MNRNLLLLAAVAFQVLAVASIAISKEWLLATGHEVVLQTAPIDPRDIFKGDYVRLDYPFSQLAVQQLDADILENGLTRGQKVYLSLTNANDTISRANRLSSTLPSDGLFLAGYVQAYWPYKGYDKSTQSESSRQAFNQAVSVRYGIEQYYVEQGKGLEIEQTRGSRNNFQVPMLMHVAVSDKGEAIIRSFEWASIAMKTEIIQSPERDAPDDQASAVMRFSIKNRGQQAITLPLKPGSCSFTLVPAASTPLEAAPQGFDRAECNTAVSSGRVLAQNETLSIDFDLNLPVWHVVHKGTATPMGKLPWQYRYRIIYQDEMIAGINATIMSRAFHGRGNID